MNCIRSESTSDNDYVRQTNERNNERYKMPQEYENVYVDLPDVHALDNEDKSWQNVANFTTKEEAVEWIRENVGHCDDDGNICLITLGEKVV